MATRAKYRKLLKVSNALEPGAQIQNNCTSMLLKFPSKNTKRNKIAGRAKNQMPKGVSALRGYFGPPMRPKKENCFSQFSSY